MKSHAIRTHRLWFIAGIFLVAFGPPTTIAQANSSSLARSVEGSNESTPAPEAPSSDAAPEPQWEIEAGGKMSFAAASVLASKHDALTPVGQPVCNVPLDPGSGFTPTGGMFKAANTPLFSYIVFAYRLNLAQAQALKGQLPSWSLSDPFDIQAKAGGNPSKDQLRLMMQSLLADKFKLAVHREMKYVSVYGLLAAEPGSFGPNLHRRPLNTECTEAEPSGEVCSVCSLAAHTKPDAAPSRPACGGITKLPTSVPGHAKVGGRDLSMIFIANALAGVGRLDRPVTDETGLAGKYDFTIEWTPHVASPIDAGHAPTKEADRAFLDAVRDQLGLILKPETRPAQIVILDGVAPLGNQLTHDPKPGTRTAEVPNRGAGVR